MQPPYGSRGCQARPPCCRSGVPRDPAKRIKIEAQQARFKKTAKKKTAKKKTAKKKTAKKKTAKKKMAKKKTAKKKTAKKK